MREYLRYFRTCVEIAIQGSLRSASNWAGVVGVALVGAILQIWGQELVAHPGWQGVVAAGLIYIAVAWLVFFLFRLIFVAPYRLYQKYRRPPALEHLNKFYVELGPLISRKLPKNDAAAFEAYLQATNTWVSETAKWIEDNLGEAARAKFLDTTGMMAADTPGSRQRTTQQYNAEPQSLSQKSVSSHRKRSVAIERGH